MRRGLIAWSRTELPERVFALRLAHAQAALAAAGLDALVTYTNHTRPAAAAWFTGFVPYWSEGALVVPATAPPQLAVALSRRVQDWIERVARIETVVSGPRFASAVAKVATASNAAARIGVLELDDLPAGFVAELRAAAPGATLVDATALFEHLRAPADAAEIALAAHAAGIAHAALAAVGPRPPSAAAALATIDGVARGAGAEEVYVAVAADLRRSAAFVRNAGPGDALGAAFAVRATVAYKGTWVRLVRTQAPGFEALVEAALERFGAAAAALPAAPAGASWLVEATLRSQPLETWVDAIPAGALVNLSATEIYDGLAIVTAAPVLSGSADRAGALLLAPVFP